VTVPLRPLRYRERAPHLALARHIACTWADAARPGLRVLPDGCMDIVWIAAAVGDGIGDGALTVAGPDTTANVVGLHEGVLTVGVRFRSGVAPGFLRTDAHDLTDRSVDLEDLWGDEALRLADDLRAARTIDAKQTALEHALLRRIDDAPRPHPDVEAAVELIASEPSHTRIGDISRQLDVGERQLRRRFERAVGYGPKTFGRVLRFRHFLDLVERDRYPLAQAAAEAGYADQPHLTRECNDLGGLPPAELIAVRNVQDPS